MDGSAKLVVLGTVAAALLLTFANLHMPVLRNSVAYGKISHNLIDSGMDVARVGSEAELNLRKPTLFPLVATPLVRVFGANVGLKLTSLLGGFAFLWASLCFFRRVNERLGVAQRYLALEIALTFLNPLVLYQFWSAYPDVMFSALFIGSFVLLDRLLFEPDRRPVVTTIAYGAVIYLAAWTKFYGAVIPLLHLAYGLGHLEQVRRNILGHRLNLRLFIAVASAVSAALLLSAIGYNPTLHIGGRAGEEFREAIVSGNFPLSENLVCLAGALLLMPGLATLFAFHRHNATWRMAPIAAVPVLFVAPLMTYPGAYNARYFVGIVPFVAVLIVSGASSCRAALRRFVLGASFVVAFATTVFFNVAPAERLLRPYTPQSVLDGDGVFDNLRLPEHRMRLSELEAVNRLPRNTVVRLISSYYGDAHRVVYERSGLFRTDLEIRYAPDGRQTPLGAAPVEHWYFPGARRIDIAFEHVSQLGGVDAKWVSPTMLEVASSTGARSSQ